MRRAMFNPDCPKVTRGGATVSERDAWVEDRVADEYRAYRIAKVACEAAQDHMRATRDVAATVQSLGALVRQAYGMANQQCPAVNIPGEHLTDLCAAQNLLLPEATRCLLDVGHHGEHRAPEAWSVLGTWEMPND